MSEDRSLHVVLDLASNPKYIGTDAMNINVRLVTFDEDRAHGVAAFWQGKGHVIEVHELTGGLDDETEDYD